MASSANPTISERFPNNAKYFVLNDKVVECLQIILAKTYEKITTENHILNEQHEIINFNILALLTIDSRSRIDSTNTRLPNIISKRIASYLTGYPIKKTNFKSVDLNCNNLYIDLKNYETMYLLLILLYYSNNIKYITKNPKCVIIDKRRKSEYNFYMQIFYIPFIEVFSFFFKNISNINDQDQINLFADKFSQFAEYEIIKEIFDAVIDINNLNLNPNTHIEKLKIIKKIRYRIVKKPNNKSNPFITIKRNLATEFSQLDPTEQLKLLLNANNSILSQKRPQDPNYMIHPVRRRLNFGKNYESNNRQKPIQDIVSQSHFPGHLNSSSNRLQTFSFNSSQNYNIPIHFESNKGKKNNLSIQPKVSQNSSLNSLTKSSIGQQNFYFNNPHNNPFLNNDNDPQEALNRLFGYK